MVFNQIFRWWNDPQLLDYRKCLNFSEIQNDTDDSDTIMHVTGFDSETTSQIDKKSIISVVSPNSWPETCKFHMKFLNVCKNWVWCQLDYSKISKLLTKYLKKPLILDHQFFHTYYANHLHYSWVKIHDGYATERISNYFQIISSFHLNNFKIGPNRGYFPRKTASTILFFNISAYTQDCKRL